MCLPQSWWEWIFFHIFMKHLYFCRVCFGYFLIRWLFLYWFVEVFDVLGLVILCKCCECILSICGLSFHCLFCLFCFAFYPQILVMFRFPHLLCHLYIHIYTQSIANSALLFHRITLIYLHCAYTDTRTELESQVYVYNQFLVDTAQ